jgi:hypothetical protein
MPAAATLFVVRRPLLAVLPAGLRHFPAVSPRVRASFLQRRLELENAPARPGGANRRTTDDVRPAA